MYFLKKNLYTLVAILFLYPIILNAAQIPIAPHINAKSWILINYVSGDVLAEGNADDRLDPASLTKMMSSYVVGQELKSGRINQNDMVTIGKDACAIRNPILRGSSLMFLKLGDRVSVSELNKGIVIQSGNDACIALANYIAGNQDAFVKLMNHYVRSLKLKNTFFKTVHGLDKKGQYSTARDMALIGQALIRDVPEEYALNKEKFFTFNNITQRNRNRLLWNRNLNVDGIKTGHTKKAGNNLVASAFENNIRLISVVMGAATDKIRFQESEKLLLWGFRLFETVIPVKVNTILLKKRVWFGNKDNANLGVEKDVVLTIPKGEIKNLKINFTLHTSQLEAPLKKYHPIGVINFQLREKIIAQQPLVVLESIQKGCFFTRIMDFVMMKLDRWNKYFYKNTEK